MIPAFTRPSLAPSTSFLFFFSRLYYARLEDMIGLVGLGIRLSYFWGPWSASGAFIHTHAVVDCSQTCFQCYIFKRLYLSASQIAELEIIRLRTYHDVVSVMYNSSRGNILRIERKANIMTAKCSFTPDVRS